jgi:hypothetical protein
MMRSCVITLQLPPILIEGKTDDTDDRKQMLRLTKDCIIYAHFADVHHPSHGSQITLLNQLCSMLTLHDSRCGHYDTQWIIDLIPKGPGFAIFAELATLFDLKAYVSELINRQDESKRQMFATSLLHYLLTSKDNYVYASYLPLPGVDMVQLLLQRGSDPNGTCKSLNSAWQKVLTYPANVVHESSCPSLIDINYDARILQRRYIEIIQLLVLSGANPDALVSDHEHMKSTAVEVVEKILVPRFPLEATPLLNALPGETQKEMCNQKKTAA